MKRSLIFISHSFIKAMEFRTEIIIWIIIETVPILVLLLAWIGIFASTPEMRGFTLPDILQYYLIARLIDTMSAVHFEEWRSREIREGKLDYFWIKPLGYPMRLFLREVGGKLFSLTLSLPSMALVIVALDHFVPGILPTPSLSQMAAFLMLVTFGFLVEYAFALFTVLSNFWLEYAEGLQHFKWLILTIFSGYLIPVEFMPDWLRTMVFALPFRYLYSVPISILQGKTQLTGIDLLAIVGTLVIAAGILRLYWKRAQLRYSSAGG